MSTLFVIFLQDRQSATDVPTAKAAQLAVCRQRAAQSRVTALPGCDRRPCTLDTAARLTPGVFSYVSTPPKHWAGYF